MGHQLVGLLRGCIQADRMVDVLMHAGGHQRVGPIDRPRRRIDEVLDRLGVPAALEDVREADDALRRHTDYGAERLEEEEAARRRAEGLAASRGKELEQSRTDAEKARKLA